VIFLLHGWGASKEKLLPLGKLLEKNGWQVFILDLPGFGKSDDPPEQWGLKEYSDFISRIIDKYLKNEKVYIFGHSFGGRIAIKLASLNPEKIKGIILCGSAGVSRANVVKRGLFLSLAKIGKLFFGENKQFSKLIYKLAREHDYEKSSGVMRETLKLVLNEDLKPLLTNLPIPVLILWGKQDQMTKYSDAIIINEEVGQSKLVSFEGSGHQLPYERPELLVKEITKWSK
jgi:pimeloyl-ACP methyl ester carboxylesterase